MIRSEEEVVAAHAWLTRRQGLTATLDEDGVRGALVEAASLARTEQDEPPASF